MNLGADAAGPAVSHLTLNICYRPSGGVIVSDIDFLGDVLKGGRTNAKVTFNVAFDAQGREVMRGISEDRRAPAGEFARCLREVGGRLSIAPPGSSVNVAIPLSFP